MVQGGEAKKNSRGAAAQAILLQKQCVFRYISA